MSGFERLRIFAGVDQNVLVTFSVEDNSKPDQGKKVRGKLLHNDKTSNKKKDVESPRIIFGGDIEVKLIKEKFHVYHIFSEILRFMISVGITIDLINERIRYVGLQDCVAPNMHMFSFSGRDFYFKKGLGYRNLDEFIDASSDLSGIKIRLFIPDK